MAKLHTSFVAHSGNNMVVVYEKHETISLLSPLNVSLHPTQDFAFLMPTQYCDLSFLMSDWCLEFLQLICQSRLTITVILTSDFCCVGCIRCFLCWGSLHTAWTLLLSLVCTRQSKHGACFICVVLMGLREWINPCSCTSNRKNQN